MLRLVRIALQIVLFFLLLSAVVGIAAPGTGLTEKLALSGAGIALVSFAPRLRRIGGSMRRA